MLVHMFVIGLPIAIGARRRVKTNDGQFLSFSEARP
jgi:hypothetical protein